MPLQTINPARQKKIVELFNATNNSTIEAGRVKTSHMATLLKKVKNSSDNISFEEYQVIQKLSKNLRIRLALQNSRVQEKKNNLLNLTLDCVNKNLTPDARDLISDIIKKRNNAIANQIIETEKKLIDAKDLCKNTLIPMLDSKIDKLVKSMRAIISSFDTYEQKTEAIRLLKEGSNLDFNKDSALTKSLFPQKHKIVATKDGGVWQLSDHKDLKNWVSLGESNAQRLSDYNALHTMKVLLTQDTGVPILPVTQNAHGKIELTYAQKILMDIAKYADKKSEKEVFLKEILQHIENLFIKNTNQYESVV